MIIRPQPATRQPESGLARINWSHPLSRGLVHYGPVGSEQRDLVSGNRATEVGSGGNITTTRYGSAWESNSLTDDGIDFGVNNRLSQLNGLVRITVAVVAAIDSSPNFGKILIIPTSNTLWTGVTSEVALSRRASSGTGEFYVNAVGISRTAICDAGFISEDGTTHTYAASKSGLKACPFYKDGLLHSTPNGSWGNDAQITVSNNHAYALSRNQTADGEGVNGRIIVSAIWARELSPVEHLAFHVNPWQMLYSNVMPINTHVAAAAASNVTSGLVNGGLIA